MLAYWVVLALTRLLSALPLRLALALGRGLADIVFTVVRARRQVVFDNLQLVFGDELSPSEIRVIAREAYQQVGQMFVEVLCSSGPRSEALMANVTYDPLDYFAEHKASGSPLIIMQGHIGNFDLTAYAFAMQGFPLHTVMKKIGNPQLNALIVGTREAHNVTVHLKSKANYQKLREVLESGGWLGVLPDQRPRSGGGVEVSFLGKPARIFPGPAMLHLDTGAPLCLAWDERLENPTLHHVHHRPIVPPAPTGDRDADITAIMQTVADAMGEVIRAKPGHYFWFHRLWGK